jgi:hypothetical protein
VRRALAVQCIDRGLRRGGALSPLSARNDIIIHVERLVIFCIHGW